MKLLINIVISVLLIVGGFAFYNSIGSKEKKQKPSVSGKNDLQVKVMKPVKESFPVNLDLWGEVKYSRIVEVRSEVEGRVLEVTDNFRPGYKVSEKLKLVTIDSSRLTKRKAEIEANVLKINAEIEQMDEEEKTLQAEIALAEENIVLAKEDVDLHLKLDNKVSKVTLNSFKQNLLRQRTALQQLISKKNLIPKKKAAIKAGIKTLKSSQALIEIDIQDAEISAPFTGVLMDPVINAGDYVKKGDVVCRIYDPLKVEIWIPVGVSEKEKLGKIQNINITGKSVTEYRYLGSADKELQSDTLIVDLTGTALKAGELVKCRMRGRLLVDVFAVPSIALRSDGESINTVSQGELRFKREVVVALKEKSKVYISSGISSEDMVIISRIYDAAEKTKVKIYGEENKAKRGKAAGVEKNKTPGSE